MRVHREVTLPKNIIIKSLSFLIEIDFISIPINCNRYHERSIEIELISISRSSYLCARVSRLTREELHSGWIFGWCQKVIKDSCKVHAVNFRFHLSIEVTKPAVWFNIVMFSRPKYFLYFFLHILFILLWSDF